MPKREKVAFLVISKSPGNVSWAGNDGYSEIPTRYYAFDSKVANSRNVVPGVLVVVRRDELVLGIGRIHTLDSTITSKVSRRCPKCRTHSLDKRKNDYRCTTCKVAYLEGDILTEVSEVISYRAYFEKSWAPSTRTVTGKDVEPIVVRKDKQSSIRGLAEPELMEIAKLLGVNLPKINQTGYYNL